MKMDRKWTGPKRDKHPCLPAFLNLDLENNGPAIRVQGLVRAALVTNAKKAKDEHDRMNTKEQPKRPKRQPRAVPTTMVADGFLDKRSVAERLGVRPRTVGEWANQGKIPAYRIGTYLRFKWAEIEAHLAQSCRVVLADSHHEHREKGDAA